MSYNAKPYESTAVPAMSSAQNATLRAWGGQSNASTPLVFPLRIGKRYAVIWRWTGAIPRFSSQTGVVIK